MAQVLPQVTFEQVRLLEHDQKQGYVIAGAGAQKFKLEDHKKMVAQLGGPSARCTEWLVNAQWRQDLFHQGDNEAHFDNCAFAEGSSYIASLVAAARDAATQYSTAADQASKDAALKAGMLALGRALHGTQDFYAHSNYLELMDSTSPPEATLAEVAVVPFWGPEGQATLAKLVKEQRLHSGTWPIGKSSRCEAPQEKHGVLAKDSNKTTRGKQKLKVHPKWAETHYAAAHQLAERASLEFLRASMPLELSLACGGNLAFLLLPADARK